jgi:hypothetical protein
LRLPVCCGCSLSQQGGFENGGREYRPKGQPEPVRVHDFLIPELGRAAPYGVYDIADNAGWVSLGIDHDTASFAVNAIRRWWQAMGRARYPQATRLLVTADCGGSNGARVRLWKRELQALANEFGVLITVCHLPPGPKQRFAGWYTSLIGAPGSCCQFPDGWRGRDDRYRRSSDGRGSDLSDRARIARCR